jgi:hypothetical protein
MSTIIQQGSIESEGGRRDKLVAAIERGELVQLLAAVDLGQLRSEEREAALEAYRKKHWARQLFAGLLGQRSG